MFNKIKKYISVSILTSMLYQFIFPVEVYANKTEQIRGELDKTNKQLSVVKEKQSAQSKKETDIKKRISQVNDQMADLSKKLKEANTTSEKNQDRIFQLLDQRESLLNEVSKLIAEIEQSSKISEILKDQLVDVLRNIYMHGSSTIFENLSAAEDFRDLVYRQKYAEKFMNYTSDLLNLIDKHSQEINLKKGLKEEQIKKIETTKNEIEKNAAENAQKATEIEQLKAKEQENCNVLEGLLKNTTKEEKEIAAARATLEKHKKELTEELEDSTGAVAKAVEEFNKQKAAQSNAGAPPAAGDKNPAPPAADDKNPAPTAAEEAAKEEQHCWPVLGNSYISEDYNARPRKGQRKHLGKDIATNGGANEVVASKSGTVVAAGKNLKGYGGYGNVIVIAHNNKQQSLYGHLSSIYVKKGQQVKQRDKIGRVGRSGWATGMHLHYELQQNGARIPPTIKR